MNLWESCEDSSECERLSGAVYPLDTMEIEQFWLCMIDTQGFGDLLTSIVPLTIQDSFQVEIPSGFLRLLNLKVEVVEIVVGRLSLTGRQQCSLERDFGCLTLPTRKMFKPEGKRDMVIMFVYVQLVSITVTYVWTENGEIRLWENGKCLRRGR